MHLSRLALVSLTALVLASVPSIHAADAPTTAESPTATSGPATGTWTWILEGRNNQTIKVTLKLNQAGRKLTGTIRPVAGGEAPIEAGKISSSGNLSFETTQQRDGQDHVTRYTGKLTGDTIKGKIEVHGPDGQVITRDFEAKRS